MTWRDFFRRLDAYILLELLSMVNATLSMTTSPLVLLAAVAIMVFTQVYPTWAVTTTIFMGTLLVSGLHLDIMSGVHRLQAKILLSVKDVRDPS